MGTDHLIGVSNEVLEKRASIPYSAIREWAGIIPLETYRTDAQAELLRRKSEG